MNALFFLIHLFLAPVALAGGGGPPGGGPRSEQGDDDVDFMANFAEISAELGLSTEQQTKIKDLFYNSRKEAIDLHASAERAELDLRHALSGDSPDEKVVMKALDAALAADAALKRNRVKLVLDLRKVVTVDQWRKLQEIRARRGGPSGGQGMAPSSGQGMGPSGGQGGAQTPPEPPPMQGGF